VTWYTSHGALPSPLVPVCSRESILGLPRVLGYSRVLDSKNYSSNLLLLDCSLILLPVANFHFRFQFLQIKLLICCHLCKFGRCNLYLNVKLMSFNFQLHCSIFCTACSLYWYQKRLLHFRGAQECPEERPDPPPPLLLPFCLSIKVRWVKLSGNTIS